MVISVWRPGVAGEMLARVTMGARDDVPVVHVVRGAVALRDVIGQWIASLDD